MTLHSYRNIISTLNYWLFLALIVSLPFHHGLIRPLWVAWLVGWALELRWLQKPDLSRQRLLSLLPVFALVVWLVWEAVSAAWSSDPDATWSLIGKHINIAAIAVIGIFGVSERYNVHTILKTLVATCVISIVYYLSVHFWLDNIKAAVSDEWQYDQWLDWGRMNNLTYALKHRLYYATLLSLALIAAVFTLPQNIREHGRWQAISVTIAAGVWLLAGIYWSGSRSSIVGVAVVFAIWAIWHTKGKKKWLTAAAIAGLFVGLAYAGLRFHSNFEGRSVAEIFAYNPQAEEPAFEPRIAEWHAALERPADYIVHGLGAGADTQYMVRQYEARGWTRYAAKKYNPHNQYIAVAIDLGLVAAMLFMLIWISLPFCQRGKAREFALYSTAILMLSMTTECYLWRIEGILTTCVLLLIILLIKPQDQLSNSLRPK